MAPDINPALGFDSFYNIINGKCTTTPTTRHGINPATEKANPAVPLSQDQDVDDAVQGAKVAFPSWSATDYSTRRQAILAFAEALTREREGFAKLLTMEQGKSLYFARYEVDSGSRWLRELANLELAEETVREDEEVRVVVRYVALGVVVAIVPWNYPIMLACGKIAPALITGNTVIVKPSPYTPYCGLKLVELAQQFFPQGVLQALSGDDELGPWLTSHPGPNKISFTGSTATGKKVAESASKTLKRVTLELGGNDAAIVCRDADIEAAASGLAHMAFLNSGQVCTAVKRIYVHDSIYEAFRSKIVDHTRRFLDNIDRNNYAIAIGGVRETGNTGYFVKPTIVDNPPDDSEIVQREPFGPVVPMQSWTDEDEVIRRANASDTGLGASVWSTDLQTAERLARRIEAGSVWINSHLELEPSAPFGGHKYSGIGCEWGLEDLKTFCNVQTLFLKKKL